MSGCASNEEIELELITYVGDHVNKAIKWLGRPDRIYDRQNNTKEYLWITNFGNATINTDFMGIPVPKGKARKDKRVLFVDQQRKVIGYLVEGKR